MTAPPSGVTPQTDAGDIPLRTCHFSGKPGHYIRDCWRKNGMMFCPPCGAHQEKLIVKGGDRDCFACVILDQYPKDDQTLMGLLAEVAEADSMKAGN